MLFKNTKETMNTATKDFMNSFILEMETPTLKQFYDTILINLHNLTKDENEAENWYWTINRIKKELEVRKKLKV